MFFDTDQAAILLSHKIPTGAQNNARKVLMRQKRKRLHLKLLVRVYILATLRLTTSKRLLYTNDK